MMNLFNKTWTDQKGQGWELSALQQNHIENIEKMLQDIINRKRPMPEDCDQTQFELKASLKLIQDELQRRKVNVKRVNTTTVTSITLKSGDTVENIITYLEELIGTEKLTNASVQLTFTS